jgi:hypothetical protein
VHPEKEPARRKAAGKPRDHRDAAITGVPPTPWSDHGCPPPLTPDLLATYRKNVLRITDPDDIDDVLLEVRAGNDGDVAIPDMHVIPAWNPGGVPTSVGQNVAHREELECDVLAVAGLFTVGAAHPPTLAWAEEVLVVRGLTDEVAAQVAATHCQPALWRLGPGRMTVLGVADAAPLAEVEVSATRLERLGCVMPRSQPEPDEVCVRAGGPWTSRSIHAAAYWTRDRNDLLAVLGCDVCGHGRRTGGLAGRPLMLHQWSVASRYGKPQILRDLTDEEMDMQ